MITLWWLALAATAWQSAGVLAENKPFAAAEIGEVCTEGHKLAAAAAACMFIAADQKDTARAEKVTAKLQGLALTAQEVVSKAEETKNTTMADEAKALATKVAQELKHAREYKEKVVSTKQQALQLAVQLTHAAAEIKQFVTIAASLVGKKGSGQAGHPCIGDPKADTDEATTDSQLSGAAAKCKQEEDASVSHSNVIETLGRVKSAAAVRFETSGNKGKVQEAEAGGECPLLNVAATSNPGTVGGTGENTIVYANAIAFKATKGAKINWEENRTFRVGGKETTLSAVRENVTAFLALIENGDDTDPYGAEHKCPKDGAGAIVCDRATWDERLHALEAGVGETAKRIRALAQTHEQTANCRTSEEEGKTGHALGTKQQGKASNKQGAITGREQCEKAGHEWNFDEGRCEDPDANRHAPSYAQRLGSAMRSAAAAHVAIGLAKCR
ncbi:hypothetical protein, conserved in T. vivax [Trypanosoma vivax Y486]|uniref:Uncharacterized protein n=1 Tax=Trypanosoma vivax (strain Y486) TaxID=1055687 RepID=F9WUP3_TRYVY|nr:hypothetical protein, conserved in T. vivax [Trypanosoma vivax Y486]|eukprot:CCD21292.1 hypothetical protein, conserved in T. vivax [Trypanosoma vivax Y486]